MEGRKKITKNNSQKTVLGHAHSTSKKSRRIQNPESKSSVKLQAKVQKAMGQKRFTSKAKARAVVKGQAGMTNRIMNLKEGSKAASDDRRCRTKLEGVTQIETWQVEAISQIRSR